MNKVVLALALGCAAVAVGCNRQADAPMAASSGTAPAGEAAMPAVQATNSAVVASPTDASGKSMGSGAALRPRFGAVLASEHTVIDGSGLSVAKVTNIIRNENFGKFIHKLAAEAATDPLAQDLAAAERKRWEQQLAGQAQLGEFACGLSVCAGSINLGANTAMYERIVDNYLKMGSESGSLLDYRLDRGDGTFEQRFVMSVDPAVGGITFNGPPVKGAPAKRPPGG